MFGHYLDRADSRKLLRASVGASNQTNLPTIDGTGIDTYIYPMNDNDDPCMLSTYSLPVDGLGKDIPGHSCMTHLPTLGKF